MSDSRYLDHVGLDIHGHRKKTGFFLETLERRRRGHDRRLRVLELGCGNGHIVSLPLAEAGHDVTGVDFHVESIEAAEAGNLYPNARFLVGDVRELDVTSGYDAVVLADVLEHVDDPSGLLRTAHGLLATDGLLLVSVPNGYGPYELEQWLQRHGVLRPFLWAIRTAGRVARRGEGRAEAEALAYNEESGHVQFFARRRLLDLFEGAGFRVVDQQNGSLFAGELSQYAYRAFPRLLPAALHAADRLPPALVSTWYFACVRQDLGGRG